MRSVLFAFYPSSVNLFLFFSLRRKSRSAKRWRKKKKKQLIARSQTKREKRGTFAGTDTFLGDC